MSASPRQRFDDYRHLRVTPRAGGFGADVIAPPLHDASPQALPETLVQEIRAAWQRHGVIAIRDQSLSPPALQALSARLGEFGSDPFVRPLGEHAHVIEVRREADETAPIFGSNWHSDWSFEAAPPVATLLYAEVVPPVGGDTLFADTAHAWRALSPTFQALLRPLAAIHSATRAYGPRGLFARDDHTRSMQIVVSDEADTETRHPLVVRLGSDGEQALYVNHVYTLRVDGMREDESRALLEFLFTHMTRAQFTYRHRWQPGTLLLWDNRRVIHLAEGGYDGHRRLLYRTTLARVGQCGFPSAASSLIA